MANQAEPAQTVNDPGESVNGSGESVNASTRFAANHVELGEILGVSRRTLSRHARRIGAPKPRPDGRHDVGAWQTFLRSGPRGAPPDADELEALERARRADRKAELQNEKLALEIGIAKRDYLPASEFQRVGTELARAVSAVIRRLHLHARSFEEVSAEAAETELKRLEDEILRELEALPDMIEKGTHAPVA